MRTPHPLPLVLGALLPAGTAAAQSSIYQLDGAAQGDHFGRSVAVLPDVDGDGRDEILVGVPRDATAGAGAGAVRIHDGATGLEVASVLGGGIDERLGWSVAAAGDVDADGVVDFIAGGPSECGTGIVGLARVFSGADRSELFAVHGDTFLDWFGCAVSAAGDQDLDGHADVAVGAHSFCSGFKLPGYVRAFSGATGEERWTATGNFQWDTYGWDLAGLGDLDQDGVPDLLVGAPGNDDGGYDAGRFHVLSGVDGAQIYSEQGEAGLHYAGFAVAATGDVDLDGTVDYAIGVPGEQDNFPMDPPAPLPGEGGGHPSDFGKFQIHSGATHTLLWERYGEAIFDHLGYAVETVGDLDQDGHPEVAGAAGRYDVQGTLISLGPAYVEVISSADGELVLHVDHGAGMLDKEVDLAAGDVNGDGVPDFVLGSPSALDFAGTVRAYSTATLGLSSPTHVIAAKKSPGAGKAGLSGKQELLIAPGEAYSGLPYRVVGSFSGLGPGFRLDGVTVPLVADDYTAYTLGDNPGDLLKHYQGVVGHGKQVATFKPPKKTVAELEGETVYHVLVVYDALGQATFVSPPVPGTVSP